VWALLSFAVELCEHILRNFGGILCDLVEILQEIMKGFFLACYCTMLRRTRCIYRILVLGYACAIDLRKVSRLKDYRTFLHLMGELGYLQCIIIAQMFS
jgi:hypothetical protein